ncbi:unnamed protein product [Protopolystoma xenopodis]|uniref:Uncharacterized protein n=1 Tax=Protopolystoma xenopodis TaxID=117903 RepID=A0A448XPV8_9PLAT|nr:unnamed protein product [Protopolystoma xenopodis]
MEAHVEGVIGAPRAGKEKAVHNHDFEPEVSLYRTESFAGDSVIRMVRQGSASCDYTCTQQHWLTEGENNRALGL